MSRSTNMVGLRPEARKWLEENCTLTASDPCPHCGKSTKTQLIGETYQINDHGEYASVGMFDEYPLNEYPLKNGKKVREVQQCEIWSSGPATFLCLELDGKRMFEWAEKEIFEQMGGQTDGE